MNPMRAKQLVVGPPSKKRRRHRSEFVAVVTGLELGGSMVVLSSEVLILLSGDVLKLLKQPMSGLHRWQRKLAVVVEVKPSKKKKRGGERETTKTQKEEEDAARWMGED
ncbi:hypothetical protein IGI04_006437 [Brassica rapa subsp. trilocularis]|uniref:Uncharacterized protein n=1 Tax=Brassica rapa subsp. trilocularis TaxID=1813537 RepID=A0ABQ7NGW0_BRACM|nr:hypothetical protein IGI04_006437 [Brassica rapa subsp. trilocularis]